MTEALSPSQYSDLLRFARRQSRRPGEAEDLLHEALIVALKADRFPTRDNRAWFFGVIRNLAAMEARTAIRRLRRETQAPLPVQCSTPQDGTVLAFARALPPALRIVMLLAIAGHNRAEIRHLLRLSDDALRQRIHVLRRTWQSAGHEKAELEFTGLHFSLETGRIRRALLAVTREGRADFASHDPDGHLFAVNFLHSAAHKRRVGGNKRA